MTKLTSVVIGTIVGGVLFQWSGAVAGLLIGLFAASVAELRERVKTLEARLDNQIVGERAQPVAEESSPTPRETPEPQQAFATPPLAAPPVETYSAANDIPKEYPAEPSSAPSPAQPSPLDNAIGWLHDFFTSGNLVVKVGVIVLFFGVGFLLKYAVEHNKFPIELRLISTAIGALALLVVGWRLRTKRPGYALIIQGAGIGVLYLTVFAAAKLYQLLPLGFAFGVMVALVVLSGILAVLQDARALAAFGAAGGFLAPVLVSTGAGNHVMLFSYYALLNAGIVGIGWFRAWRELNLIGFAFTFVIGVLWGHHNYQPELFASTEPFLVLFFLFYVAIAILFAHRQPLQLRGYIDGTIVFGVPVVGFGLQAVLVRPYEYALAMSALAMSGLYIGLAAALWRRHAPADGSFPGVRRCFWQSCDTARARWQLDSRGMGDGGRRDSLGWRAAESHARARVWLVAASWGRFRLYGPRIRPGPFVAGSRPGCPCRRIVVAGAECDMPGRGHHRACRPDIRVGPVSRAPPIA